MPAKGTAAVRGPGPGSDAVVRVSEATQVSPALVEAFERLLPQLSRSAPALDLHRLDAVVSSPATVLLVARGDGRDDAEGFIVGTLTLALFPIPTGIRAWVEDVVVDESWRGRGVGEALIQAALDRAGGAGARTVDLTSRPSREAANRLYLRLGFSLRDTNVYRIDLQKS